MKNCVPKTEVVGDSGIVVHCLNDHLVRKGFHPKCCGVGGNVPLSIAKLLGNISHLLERPHI